MKDRFIRTHKAIDDIMMARSYLAKAKIHLTASCYDEDDRTLEEYDEDHYIQYELTRVISDLTDMKNRLLNRKEL